MELLQGLQPPHLLLLVYTAGVCIVAVWLIVCPIRRGRSVDHLSNENCQRIIIQALGQRNSELDRPDPYCTRAYRLSHLHQNRWDQLNTTRYPAYGLKCMVGPTLVVVLVTLALTIRPESLGSYLVHLPVTLLVYISVVKARDVLWAKFLAHDSELQELRVALWRIHEKANEQGFDDTGSSRETAA
ncbi:MAG: hypothetical protein AAF662_16490 [Pseudomonadota bacterium]